MSSLGLSRGWAHAPDTLDPPPTPEELVWWDEHKVSLLRNEVIKGTLVMQVPFIAGIALTRGWHGMLSLGGLAALRRLGADHGTGSAGPMAARAQGAVPS